MIIYAGGGEGIAGSQLYTIAQINFGDLTPYLTMNITTITRLSLKIREKNSLIMRGVNVNVESIFLPTFSRTATFRQFMKVNKYMNW